MKVGICISSLEMPVRRALREAERMGVGGVQLDAVGELAPKNLSQTGRRELRHVLESHNLAVTAVGCPLRHGLAHPENYEARIEHVKRVLELSYDLKARIVVAEAGRVPEPDQPDPLHEPLQIVGQYGDRIGAVLAWETGIDSGEKVADYLRRFRSAGLAVNFSPGNLLLHGHDPAKSARALGDLIVHVHAKDARLAAAGRTAQEVPLGHGDVDWMHVLSVLAEIEYRGWLTIVRPSGEDQPADLTDSIAFLRRLIP
ncbi:MAG: hypothetical protein KatS3mg105_0726 [Gemmatales bacterium]|nr:MAG: hypothetical protein KatS3mg105_0726 [Gemmatales bacterium]